MSDLTRRQKKTLFRILAAAVLLGAAAGLLYQEVKNRDAVS